MFSKSRVTTIAVLAIMFLMPKHVLAQASLRFSAGPVWNDAAKTATFDISWGVPSGSTSANVVAKLERWNAAQGMWVLVTSSAPLITMPPYSGTFTNQILTSNMAGSHRVVIELTYVHNGVSNTLTRTSNPHVFP